MSKPSASEMRQKRLHSINESQSTTDTNSSVENRIGTQESSSAVSLSENTSDSRTSESGHNPSPLKQVRLQSDTSGYNETRKGVELEDDEDEDLKAALALSLQEHNPPKTSSTSFDSSFRDIHHNETEYYVKIEKFHNVMWDNSSSGVGGTTKEDQSRWISQGILFSSSNMKNNISTTTESSESNQFSECASQLKWGLVQKHGGPCGVLAAIQAEVLKILLFESPKPQSQQNVKDLGGDEEYMQNCLALAMARILARVAVSQKSEAQSSSLNPHVNVVLPYSTDEKIVASTHENSSSFSCEEKFANEYKGLDWGALNPWPWGNAPDTNMKCKSHILTLSELQMSSGVNVEKQLTDMTLQFLKDRMRYFNVSGGVLLFVMSLVETRGAESIKSDMDDPQFSHLTSQFGHCSQELLNLLLTGEATTNVFDHTMNMSGLIIHGISQRPTIGYLTQLESLRYCTVGTYYKTPSFPVWVVGSQSHFTVLFSQDEDVVKETESESILERCRRVFKGIDCAEENGFIQVSSLGKLLRGLDLEEKVGGENGINLLSASLEVSGAGIILWDDFWKVAGRLMTGASLESVLQGDYLGAQGSENSVNAIGGISVADNMDLVDSAVSRGYNTNEQTANDEEVARRLAAAYGMDQLSSTTSADAVTKTDEEIARELQAQFDAEESNTTADLTPTLYGETVHNDTEQFNAKEANTTTDLTSVLTLYGATQPQNLVPDEENKFSMEDQLGGKENDVPPPAPVEQEITKKTANTDSPAIQQARQSIEFERFGDTFTLHHYNGLRGGILTSFKITKLSAEDAVGASVALSQSSSNNAGGPQEFSQRNRSSGDLEDIVRTRWPSCAFNWGENEDGGGKIGVSLID